MYNKNQSEQTGTITDKTTIILSINYTRYHKYIQVEDTKEVIRNFKSKDRQYNGQRKGEKRQTIAHKTLHRKLKIE